MHYNVIKINETVINLHFHSDLYGCADCVFVNWRRKHVTMYGGMEINNRNGRCEIDETVRLFLGLFLNIIKPNL